MLCCAVYRGPRLVQLAQSVYSLNDVFHVVLGSIKTASVWCRCSPGSFLSDFLQEALVTNMVDGHVKRRENSFHDIDSSPSQLKEIPVFLSLLRI